MLCTWTSATPAVGITRRRRGIWAKERAPTPFPVPGTARIGANPQASEHIRQRADATGFRSVERNPALMTAYRQSVLQAGGPRFEPGTAHAMNSLLRRGTRRLAGGSFVTRVCAWGDAGIGNSGDECRPRLRQHPPLNAAGLRANSLSVHGSSPEFMATRSNWRLSSDRGSKGDA